MKKAVSLLILAILPALVLAGCAPSPPPPPPAEPKPTPTPAPPTETPAPPAPSADTATPLAEEVASPTPELVAHLEIYSSAFEPDGEIPVQYSCDGANLSPPLDWSGVHEGAQSLVLLVDDPDSEPPGFVHWVIYNIPLTTTGFPEGVPAQAALDDGSLQGTNDFALFVEEGESFPSGAPINLIGYDGPCPGNPHRYVFALYALDTLLDLPAEANEAQVLQAMEGHILAQAEVTAVYSPQR